MSLKTEDLKAGDILLYNSDGWLPWAICKFDNAEVSHAGLYLGNGHVAEVLAAKNAGLHRHALLDSFGDSNWVDVRRLKNEQAVNPLLHVAEGYAWQGNRYAYLQILMLASICLTRKIDQGNWFVARLAERTLRGAADILQRRRRENREPMICSEFVFRVYDEADPDKNDPYSLTILSQGDQGEHRHFSPRRLHFGSTPATGSPTVHPDSLLAELESDAQRLECRYEAGPQQSEEEIEAEVEDLARQYAESDSGSPQSVEAYMAAPPTDEADVKSAAAQFAAELIDATRPTAVVVEGGRYGAESRNEETDLDRLKRVVADFVTPGDLHRSPSLRTIGRLESVQ